MSRGARTQHGVERRDSQQSKPLLHSCLNGLLLPRVRRIPAGIKEARGVYKHDMITLLKQNRQACPQFARQLVPVGLSSKADKGALAACCAYQSDFQFLL